MVAGCGADHRSAAGSSNTSSGTTASAFTVDATLRQQIARTFAPQLRFNAFHDDGSGSTQNRNEDYFPMGAASFLREIVSGQARVVVQESDRYAASLNEVRPFYDVARLQFDHLGPYPRRMAGDAPGTAPMYVNVYEDPTARWLASDGSSHLTVYAEYWTFFAYDRAQSRVLNMPFSRSSDVGGHRADWEHTTFRLRLQLDPGGGLVGGQVEEGYYFGHGTAYSVSSTLIERVDDQGRPNPGGTHPVVYVSQGKHASYPQAGHWPVHRSFPAWVATHTDYFRGNGVIIDGWHVPLHDLETTSDNPVEFASSELALLRGRSPSGSWSDWTSYPGRWGPDLTVFQLPGTGSRVMSESPCSPKHMLSYSDFGGGGSYERWADVKASEPGLVIYLDRGISIPALPAPLPTRR